MLRACARPRNFVHVFCAFVYTCIHYSCMHTFKRHAGKELDGRAITCNNARQTTYDKAPVEGAGEGGGGGDGGGGGGEEMAGDE